ncbi:6-phosphogluconolactonase [Sulfitobacter sp. G21635-S1]|jgi:6-phosphogluconolactonase|uniref:6-phosphogluconolactonase n=1 Tax=Sulfitobacter sp. G21635-S1 TaxID=3014043 RepID=UPI0022AE9CCA|nr:6-phosphogluconolactonase [Sulfitobacter sp. G21635-S1]MCZ4254977.1 6-phosphogluconolactonase [Sulfitobacter sp. G21635-S1]
MNLIEYPDREILAMKVANRLAGELKKCLLVHEFASFAVPGGTTPGPVFDMLSGTDLDWGRVHVMLTDERWVPEEDARSNGALVRSRLLTGHAAAAQFLPFYQPGLEAEEGAAAIAPGLETQLPLSLLVLGMGDDMHTASLFPGAPGVAAAMAAGAPNLCVVRPEDQEIARVTLPAHVLRGAMSTHLIIFGDAKRAALERAETLPPEEAPVATVLNNAEVHWAA